MTSTLPQWLSTRTQEELTGILQRRTTALEPYPPNDLDQLAERLHHQHSLRLALFAMPAPCLDLLETLLVFGSGGMTRGALAAVLDVLEDNRELDATLATCAQWALAWETDGRIWVPGALRSIIPAPLRLGPPVADLLGGRPVNELQQRAHALGLESRKRKADILAVLAAFYADGDAIRARVAGGPADQIERITDAALRNPFVHSAASYYYAGRVDPAIGWLVANGLVYSDWQHTIVPREVGIALRGPLWHPTLQPHPSALADRAVHLGVDVIDRDAAAAASAAIEAFTALVEACGATPIALLKSGGVGVREIRRLAKTVRIPESSARLWLEIAYAGDFIDVDDSGRPGNEEIVPTPDFDVWVALPAAERLAALVASWAELEALPLLEKRPEGVPAPNALMPDEYGMIAAELRFDVLRAAASVPDGFCVADQDGIGELIAWERPLVSSMLRDASFAVTPIWAEAAMLGLIGRDGCSSLGREFLAGPDEFLAAAGRLIQDATAEAIFQADLTIVVPGSPTAVLAQLLDSAADRESRGAAGTWRASPDSVRRALDAGQSATDLLDALRAVAVGGVLPQPLEYLVTDVARRHGTLRVRTVGCVLRADDPALLAEIAATKSLASLRLSLLAPTVLASALPIDKTLTALRSAGYAPVGESADGSALIERRDLRRAAPRATVLPFQPRDDHAQYAVIRQSSGPGRASASSRDVALALLEGGPAAKSLRSVSLDSILDVGPTLDAGRTRDAGPTLDAVRRSAVLLNPDKQALLAAAIDDAAPVRIGYTDARGRSTSRVIEPIELDGVLLVAWCRTRDDERAFALANITSVHQV